MTPVQFLPRSLAALCLAGLIAAGPAAAQPATDYQPTVGQQGKDVVWVPTPDALVEKMLDTAKVTPNDYVVDLGSGDGRTVIEAAKRGATALGIEYNQDMVDLATRNAAKAGVSDKAKFIRADLFETDFSQATVVTMFLLPDINLRLRPKILDMKPGTRVVSNTFTMGEWTADETVSAPECKQYCTAYYWIVPAKVEGTWRLGEDGELTLKQQFQMVSGTVKHGNVVAPITAGKLTGDEITFTAGGREYKGRVNGDLIEGTVQASESKPWRATRS